MAIVLLLVMAALVIVGLILYFVFRGISKASGPRYQGEAPHQGPVMRFTGTSSEVKQDTGDQNTTRV